MCNDNSVFATLIVAAIGDAKPYVVVIAEYIVAVSGAIHPGCHDSRASEESVGEVFAGYLVLIPGLLKEVPWLCAVWSHVCPIVAIYHVLRLGLS